LRDISLFRYIWTRLGIPGQTGRRDKTAQKSPRRGLVLLLAVRPAIRRRVIVVLGHMVLVAVLVHLVAGPLLRLIAVVEKVLALEAAEPILHCLVRPTRLAELVHIVRLVLRPTLVELVHLERLSVAVGAHIAAELVVGLEGAHLVLPTHHTHRNVIHFTFSVWVECNITYYRSGVKPHPATSR
jgi:hypothetical protein